MTNMLNTKELQMVGGTPMTEAEANTETDLLYAEMFRVADERVTHGTFMQDLAKGTLSQDALRVFWLNWTGFVSEINNFIQCAYQRHLGFFKEHLDLFAVFADKVADELIHPRAPGHLLVVWEQGEIFGLERGDMLTYEMLPECRVLNDYHRGMLHEGTLLEFWLSIAWEEYVGHWCQMFRAGLARLGYSERQAPYFTQHEEADLTEHEGGVMGHGDFNRAVVQRLFMTGNTQMRPGHGRDYVVTLAPYYFGMFLDACHRSAAARP